MQPLRPPLFTSFGFERAARSGGDDFKTLSTLTCAALRAAGDKAVFAFDEEDGSEDNDAPEFRQGGVAGGRGRFAG